VRTPLLLSSAFVTIFLFVGISYAHCYGSAVSPSSGDTSTTFNFCGSTNDFPSLLIDGTFKGLLTSDSLGKCTDLTGIEYEFSMSGTELSSGTHTYTVYTGHGDCDGTFEITSGPVVASGAEGFEGTFPPSGWTTGGDANWFEDSSAKFEGTYSAASGAISHLQATYLKVTKTYSSDGQIKFYWKVSSEDGWDYLIFYVDGVQKDVISGEEDWQQKTYPITAGTHTFEWRYETDGYVLSGSNRGWLDKVEFIGTGGDGAPPVRSSGQPKGTIKITNPTLSLNTDESATCKYSTTAGTSYDSMTNTFSTTGETLHSQPLSGLTDGIKIYYVRCIDSAGNKNTDDYPIAFTVDTTPPSTSIVSVGGDTSSPYYDNVNDEVTQTVINGEFGMSCRWYTSDVAYDPGSGTACTTLGSQVTCTVSTTSGSYTRYVACADAAGNGQNSSQNLDISWIVDYTPPTCSISGITESSSYAYVSGSTIYYSTASTGIFDVAVSASDSGSGVKHVEFPTTVSSGGTDSSSPYSWTYNWDTLDTFDSIAYVLCYDNANNFVTTGFRVYRDTSSPYSGSIIYTNGYYTTSVPIILNPGLDTQSGINIASDYIERQEATLSVGTCGNFGSWSIVASDPATKWTDTNVAHAKCYKYRYSVRDNVYNLATYTSGGSFYLDSIAKVDTTPPSAGQAEIYSGTTYQSGSNYWYKGTVSIRAPAADSESLISVCEYTLNGVFPGSSATYDGTYCKKDLISPASNIIINLINFKATNGAGVPTTGTSRIYTYDNTPPTTGISATSPPGGASYTFNTPTTNNVQVTLSCADNAGGSGCASGYPKYCTDSSNTCPPSTTYSSPFTISAEGTTYVRYQSEDNLGNTETISRTVIKDTTPPTGSVSINGGAAYTSSTSVTLSLSCSDASGCTHMKISNTLAGLGTATIEAYTSSKAWPLLSGDGTKAAYVVYGDGAGNWMPDGSAVADTIDLDTTKPYSDITTTPPTWLTSNLGLSVTDSDTGSGVSTCSYHVCDNNPSCTWTQLNAARTCSSSFTVTVGSTGDCKTQGSNKCQIQVLATDVAGNTGDITISGDNFITTNVDYTPPTGSVSINGGAAYTSSTSVTLSLSCSDASGCTHMKVSNTLSGISTATAEAYATPKAWTLLSGDGTKTVYVVYRDGAGNWMPDGSAVADTIDLDTTPPTGSTVEIPSNTNHYRPATMPTSFSGKAKDNAGGGGLNANSVTFYIKSASDNNYWTGSTWTSSITWLPTVHVATTGDTEVTWTSSATLPAWSDGTYYSKAKTTDKVAYTFEGSEISFVYDSIPPVTNIDSPAASIWFKSDFTLQYDTTDVNIDICSISTKDGVGSWIERSTACGNEKTLTITVGSGKYCASEGSNACSIKVYAKDKSTNSNEVTRSFSIDLTPPTIDSLTHSPDIITPEIDVTIISEASDSLSGISDIKIYVEGQLKRTCTSSPCLYISRYDPGTYHYYTEATDKVGNMKSSSTQQFKSVVPEAIPLKSGWNLFSIPYKTFGFALSTCEGGRNFYNYDTVTKTWNIVKNVEDVQGGKGYWVYSANACEIKIIGNQEVLSNDIDMISGWNQIGSPNTEPDFNSIKCSGGSIDTILSYDTGINEWKVLTGNPNLEKYKGYFVKASCP